LPNQCIAQLSAICGKEMSRLMNGVLIICIAMAQRP
jgi:hypothetical protein